MKPQLCERCGRTYEDHAPISHSFAYYTPEPQDIKWARRVLSLLNEGGILVYPQTKAIYKVSHKDKTLILQNEEILDTNDAYIHYRGIQVFDKIGYRMMP